MEQGTGDFSHCWRHFSRVSHNSFFVLTYCHLSSQIGPSPRSMYTVQANGSLLLQPLSKDHHGGWECLATNRVATVSTGTVVMVLGECVSTVCKLMCYYAFSWIKESTNIVYFSAGTSPHAVSSATVTTEMNQANVSWVPGFDGGYTQKFTVWWGTYYTFYYAALSCP